jgi:gamma-glutamyltranspeptidase
MPAGAVGAAAACATRHRAARGTGGRGGGATQQDTQAQVMIHYIDQNRNLSCDIGSGHVLLLCCGSG